MIPITTTLDRMAVNASGEIVTVVAPSYAPEWLRWLEDIGFVAGERVALLARAQPGGDPLVVRIGQSTFALRCAEALCVHVANVVPSRSS